MQFKDEFEVPTESGKTYYVEVEGNTTEAGVDLELVTIYDELGNVVDEDHEDYAEVQATAVYHEYDIEHFSEDFDYYNTSIQVAGFGKDWVWKLFILA